MVALAVAAHDEELVLDVGGSFEIETEELAGEALPLG